MNMLKVTDSKTNEIRYILTEAERVSLVSDRCKRYMGERIQEVKFYENKMIDFFTGKKIDDGNEWHFNVEKDGVIFICSYDNNSRNNKDLSELEEEARLLMWRYSNDGGFGYTECIGCYIEGDKKYHVTDTRYNDVKDWYFDKENNQDYQDEEAEEIELNDSNREEVKTWLLSL